MGVDIKVETQGSTGAENVITMAVVNPYTKNVDASKAIARAISYDYADYLGNMAKKSCARADLKVKSPSAKDW